jgi:dienelactone hydrolase
LAPDAVADQATTDQAPLPFTVQNVTLIDSSRLPPDRGVNRGTVARTMRTVIRRPAGSTGPLPLIVFAHGYDAEPETYGRLLDAWASAGYLVAAPELPGSAHDLAGQPVRDIADQARDLSFVLTALLDGQAGPIDVSRVAAAGHSDGASAVATLALNSAFSDTRFSAYLVLSGAIPDQVVEGAWNSPARTGQLLVTVGDHDEFGNLTESEAVFDTATLPGAFVRVPGGDHLQIYTGDSQLAGVVRATTLQFLDVVIKDPNDSSASSFAALGRGRGLDVTVRPAPSG